MSNPVVWFEIYVQDMPRARAFYETVLNLQLSPLPAPPGEAADLEMLAFPMQPETGGAGGTLVRMEGMPSGGNSTLVYFACTDCATEVGRVAAAGGKVFKDKFAIGPYGFCALAVDTEGNMFGLHSMA
jgi:predicted enzyme related to lactoylglutathione lyase